MSSLAGLRQAIGRIAEYCPWYVQELGVPQGQEEAEVALEKLPLVTASVLEAHYYTENNPLLQRDGLHRYQTSGTSSGRRKTIFYSDRDEEAYLRIKLDVFREILGPYGYRTALADMGTGHAEATAVEVFRELGMDVESVSFRLPIEQHLARLASFRPEVLYTMPSILERILLASDNPSGYGIRHVVLVGEIASASWIRRAAERLGLGADRITDTYGSIEIGTIAYYSHRHGRYLLTEGLAAEGLGAEALNEEWEPLPEGEQVLVLSSTVREAFPALRYVTYDVVRDLRPIRVDGRLRQSFHSVVKRIGPDLKHGEKISIYDIEDVVCRHLNEAGVRVSVAGNALKVHVYSSHADPSRLESLKRDLENRIPEIGAMIRAGILEGIQVIGERFEDSQHRSSVKAKKIYYEVEGSQ
ncbi:phenylacetate--CoA ligase family protein [Paenibacillus ehimensis]|uniref:CoF synthetase n=1 Tax=Paenibacillus ehimensis TaxID=79264 RepID=UPI001FEBE70E|nr:CoF synthetase [Paenibacillus ehimensis]